MATFQVDEEVIDNFSSDVGGLWCRPLDILNEPPGSFVFLRDYVSSKVPCIIRNAIPSSDAVKSSSNGSLRLTLDDIIDIVGEQVNITVDITPDGHGDAIRTVKCVECLNEDNFNDDVLQKMFVKPHEQEMNLALFRSMLRSKRSERTDDGRDEAPDSQHYQQLDDNGLEIYLKQNKVHGTRVRNSVVYYSRQNDCLRTEMSSLFSTGMIPSSFEFAEQAFDTGPPDAINLWIGNEKSVSSMHKDHYENLFYVCSGEKEFILLPPADIPFMYEEDFDSGTFFPRCHNESGDLADASWIVKPDCDDATTDGAENTKARWIEPDIKRYMEGKYSQDKFPLLSKSHPIKVLVSQGEMLYIPSLWLHRVTQTTETVGINYWFDMKFDSSHWSYFNLLQQMKRKNV